MKKVKFIIFAFTSLILSTLIMISAILAFDILLHKKFEKYAGLNIRGYRGPVVGRKQPKEQRIVVLGGSTVFGYGVTSDKTFAAYLERKLNEQHRQTSGSHVSVVNLGYNNDGAYSFKYTLKDYNYLNYDIVILYEGYNDLGYNDSVYRHQSPIFKLTGYMPIFPVVFIEKAKAIRYGGDLESAYWGKKTVFRPNISERVSATALETAVRIQRSLEQQIGRLAKKPEEKVAAKELGCQEQWRHYCQSIYEALDYSLSRGKHVFVVTQPYASDLHIEQQQNMVGMLQRFFANYPNLHYVNLARTINLKDNTLCYDGMHLTPKGNEQIAKALVPYLLENWK